MKTTFLSLTNIRFVHVSDTTSNMAARRRCLLSHPSQAPPTELPPPPVHGVQYSGPWRFSVCGGSHQWNNLHLCLCVPPPQRHPKRLVTEGGAEEAPPTRKQDMKKSQHQRDGRKVSKVWWNRNRKKSKSWDYRWKWWNKKLMMGN